MKKLQFVFLFVFLGFFVSSHSGFAQAEKSNDENFQLSLAVRVNGEKNIYELTGVESIKISSSENLLRIVTFKIAPEEEIMELANPVAFLRVTAKGDFYGDGEEITITDNFAVLTNSGNLKLVYHAKKKEKIK